TVTTFDSLAAVTKDAYFTPGRRRLLLVVLTDAESIDFDAQLLRDTLARRGIRTVLVRVGSTREHVFGREGLPEAAFHPEPTARTVTRFVQATGARAFGEGDLEAAASHLRADAGHGARVRLGTETDSTDVAPYLLAAAFFPLGLLVFRRNVL